MSLIKERIAGTVKFQYYRDKELWYKTNDGFLFPVHVDDASGATFKDEDKGILFMRWIRKYMESMNSD